MTMMVRGRPSLLTTVTSFGAELGAEEKKMTVETGKELKTSNENQWYQILDHFCRRNQLFSNNVNANVFAIVMNQIFLVKELGTPRFLS